MTDGGDREIYLTIARLRKPEPEGSLLFAGLSSLPSPIGSGSPVLLVGMMAHGIMGRGYQPILKKGKTRPWLVLCPIND